MRSKSEIDEQTSVVLGKIDAGESYFGMTYEEGVLAALDWVVGNTNDKPIEEE